MLSMYPACFFKEETGYSVIFPDLNCSTCGESFEHAMTMAVDCLAGILYSLKNDGEIIPKPSELSSIDYNIIAKELYPEESIPNCIVSMVSVDVDLYAKEYFEKSVKKTLTIPAWLNKLATEQHINFSQVLREALITKLQL